MERKRRRAWQRGKGARQDLSPSTPQPCLELKPNKDLVRTVVRVLRRHLVLCTGSGNNSVSALLLARRRRGRSAACSSSSTSQSSALGLERGSLVGSLARVGSSLLGAEGVRITEQTETDGSFIREMSGLKCGRHGLIGRNIESSMGSRDVRLLAGDLGGRVVGSSTGLAALAVNLALETEVGGGIDSSTSEGFHCRQYSRSDHEGHYQFQ